jgi:hypothetical protein
MSNAILPPTLTTQFGESLGMSMTKTQSTLNGRCATRIVLRELRASGYAGYAGMDVDTVVRLRRRLLLFIVAPECGERFKTEPLKR